MIRSEVKRHHLVGVTAVSFVALIFLIVFSVPLTSPLTDLFHEGEYLSPRLLSGSKDLPLLIHGLIDLWPSQIAAWTCGNDSLIMCTRASNAALTAIASLLFVACAFEMKQGPSSNLLAAGGAILILLLVNGRANNPVELQQGSPAGRDVILLAELLCLSVRSGRTVNVRMAAAGLLAALGLFWTYNRGLIGVAALGVYIFSCLVIGRRRGALIASAAFASTFALILLAFPDAARQHVTNIAYWARHSDIWAYPDPLGRAGANAGFYSMACLVLVAGGLAAWRQRRTGGLPMTLVLLVVAALIIQQIQARDDWTHLMFAVPWLFLLALRAVGSLVRPGATHAIGAGSLSLAFGIGAVMIVPLYAGLAANGREARAGLLHDKALLSQDTQQTAAMLRRAAGTCTYVIDNGMALYSLSGKPPCSRVIAPVYAQNEAETILIADLARARPPMIMGLSHEWYSMIDNRPLASRTPRLAAWIDAHYALGGRAGSHDVLILRP